ncbi:MAG TPA: hypothetical protein VNW92_26655, partial [Polyangiaceae bacterium]|nr:hypothetical protein [Polyangiaceae bacterium]
TADLLQNRSDAQSTVRVSVQNSTLTLDFRGLLNDTGAFTVQVELPNDQTQPPTSSKVVCSATPSLVPTGSTLSVDYTASATTLKLVNKDLSTLEVYTKL